MNENSEVSDALGQIVAVIGDDERTALEDKQMKPYDSGLHDEDPQDQPSQDPNGGNDQ